MPTQKVLIQRDSLITFGNNSNTTLWTPKNKSGTSGGSGRLSTRHALPAMPRGGWLDWFAEFQCQATPSVGNLIRLYIFWWFNADAIVAGGIGNVDADLSSENQLLGADYIGNAIVHAAAADTKFVGNGGCPIPPAASSMSIAMWNASGATTTNDDTEHVFGAHVSYPDIQAAA